MPCDETISYIKQHFPNTPTSIVADAVNLTISQVRTIAKKYHIKKCDLYKEELKRQLVTDRGKWFEDSIAPFEPSDYQEQLLFGSLLGDGFISNGAARSVNCYYQEHFGEGQRGYREWKLSQLRDLSFTINGNYLRSASHPYFKQLRELLYPFGRKTLDKTFLARCTHPVFFAALYLDDGSLSVSFRYNARNHTVYCMPSIMLYTLNFTQQENQVLADHLNETFGTSFVLSGHPDGHKSLLKLNKEQEVRHLFNMIGPYVKEINCMRYKTDLEENISLKYESLQEKFGRDIRIVVSSSERFKTYTKEEIERMTVLKNAKFSDQMIADELGRSYWSVVYKLKELRRKGCL
ncbi:MULTISPECIES: hypothetical protein [unclassified Sporosarcina]|uniref:hypothetical protein n=1 Tax=unclassified Sporosarcina TaxID=2647733 RepID=UPI00203ECFAF|nr:MULTISPECIES: hypothetical protein [unclassified Sporosarcina]GKV64862.1 hypothetical protein NCCP2331_10150 [Sporosarcina sp. NCCP-2331]GLB54972.1 hypothetical protein NCCP2378_07570 [Sporosarcina sp. NCCP-2378]